MWNFFFKLINTGNGLVIFTGTGERWAKWVKGVKGTNFQLFIK